MASRGTKTESTRVRLFFPQIKIWGGGDAVSKCIINLKFIFVWEIIAAY